MAGESGCTVCSVTSDMRHFRKTLASDLLLAVCVLCTADVGRQFCGVAEDVD